MPTFTSLTSSPIAATIPVASTPGIQGTGIGEWGKMLLLLKPRQSKFIPGFGDYCIGAPGNFKPSLVSFPALILS